MKRTMSLAVGVILAATAADTAEVSWVTKPTAVKDGGGVKIAFTVSAPTDVEVAVLASDGKVVRHLAAGVLGKGAPEPLKPDLLEQRLVWDGKDDSGRAAEGEPFRARVRIGMSPRLEKYLGGAPYYWDGQIRGLAVSPAGEVYVLSVCGAGYAGTRASLRVLDSRGEYRRTIVPYPASLPPERTEPMGHLLVEGRRLPAVCNGYSGTLAPMLTGMPRQGMVWSPQGHLLLASAVGSMDDPGPPRHILALDSDGGAPAGVGFVGPQIARAPGRAGGSLNGALCYDSLAVSPDGQWIYYSGYKEADKKPRHVVLQCRWKDAEPVVFAGKDGEPGDDDAHLRDPQGLAVDAAGNVYVCDSGNNRLVILSPDGKTRASVAVEAAQQVAVHPKSGEAYVVSRKAAARPGGVATTAVHKFSPLGKEPPRLLWSESVPGLDVMALDPASPQTRLWLAVSAGGRAMSLLPADEKDGKLELGRKIGDSVGLMPAGVMSAGREANEVLVAGGAGFMRVDLKTGEQAPLVLGGGYRPSGEITRGRDGNLYVQGGGGGQDLYRFNAKGEPLPFKAVADHKLRLDRRTHMLRGFCVARNGTIYVLAWDYRKRTYLDSYDADGKPAGKDIIKGLASGATGVQVDAGGGIYITENIKPADSIFPPPFSDRLSPVAWKWFDAKAPRAAPWRYTFDNAYLSFWGCVMKFPSTGGVIYGLAADGAPVTEAPAECVAFKSGYLARDVRVAGAKWIRPCVTYAGSHDFGTDGANCMCISSRMALDDYGRLYAPDPYRFCIEVFDSNGNTVSRIGSYGNVDSAGPASRVPAPEIALAWPRYVACVKDRLVVSDAVSRRLVVVRLECSAEGTCPVQ